MGVGAGAWDVSVCTIVSVTAAVVSTAVLVGVVGAGEDELVVLCTTGVVCTVELLTLALLLLLATTDEGVALVVLLLSCRLATWPAGANFSRMARISLVPNSDESERVSPSLTASGASKLEDW